MMKKHLKLLTRQIGFEKRVHKRKIVLLALSCTALLLISGCQNGDKTSLENNQVIDSPTSSHNAMTQEETNNSEATSSNEESSSKQSNLQFSELAKYQFVFSSGVGAWQTLLNINEDGTFTGDYSDSDMGDTGEGYPNGIIYSSTFEGKFTTLKRVNDYTYSTSIEAIKLQKEVGKEEIIDGIKYIYSKPYGLDDAKEIYIYTTEAPIKDLPEGFKSWVSFGISDKDEYLPFYGLYNVETEDGFSSYRIDEVVDHNLNLDIEAEIADIEKQYIELNNQLKNDDLNQLEMNVLAKKIYQLWDDELNKVWKYLKNNLDKAEMDALTTKQKQWISMKEKEIKKAGSEYEGGSIRPMIEYLVGAELTRDRVYELIEYLK